MVFISVIPLRCEQIDFVIIWEMWVLTFHQLRQFWESQLLGESKIVDHNLVLICVFQPKRRSAGTYFLLYLCLSVRRSCETDIVLLYLCFSLRRSFETDIFLLYSCFSLRWSSETEIFLLYSCFSLRRSCETHVLLYLCFSLRRSCETEIFLLYSCFSLRRSCETDIFLLIYVFPYDGHCVKQFLTHFNLLQQEDILWWSSFRRRLTLWADRWCLHFCPRTMLFTWASVSLHCVLWGFMGDCIRAYIVRLDI